MSTQRVTPASSVAQMAEQFITSLNTLRREEVVLNTPRATVHSDAVATADGHARGLACATSVLQITLEEAVGDVLDRGIAREIARRVIRAYHEQIEKAVRS